MEAVRERTRVAPAPAPEKPSAQGGRRASRPAWGHELDALGARTLRRACACGGACGDCGDERELRRAPAGAGCPPVPGEAPAIVHDVLRQPGRPLEAGVRAALEPRLGTDLGGVRVHDDGMAAASARAVGALAYTVGRDVVFDHGRYAPGTADGHRLLVHELTHVAQQRDARATGPIVVGAPQDAAEHEADRAAAGASGPVTPGPRRLSRACGPAVPRGGPCVGESGFLPGDRFDFVVNCDDLIPSEEARLRTYPARISSGDTVEIHGFASVDGAAGFNEELSCARAMRAQAILSAELAAAGKSATLTLFKHGATAGPASERRSVVLVPRLAAPPAPTCAGHILGTRGVCGTGTDFTFHDFPAISSTVKSLAVAGYRPQSDASLEGVMQFSPFGLVTIGGTAGSAAFTQFKSGGGATVTHGPASTLGALALTSPEFAAAVAAVQADVQSQLTAQATAGPIDCLALAIPAARLPVVSWRTSTLLPLTAVIGGTHGLVVSLASFVADPVTHTYSIGLRFEICDNFGVDEADLYADSLIAFWLLQHERVGYRPFINTIDLTQTVTGRF